MKFFDEKKIWCMQKDEKKGDIIKGKVLQSVSQITHSLWKSQKALVLVQFKSLIDFQTKYIALLKFWPEAKVCQKLNFIWSILCSHW